MAGATLDPRFEIRDFTIQPPSPSRMYYPYTPDCPPMPPDDPESHELMQCVDGKRGWKHWDRYGCTNLVDNPGWERFLPRDERGVVVLDRQAAVQVAFLNSREYQTELEDLYLSALGVTFERFRFDTQFFGGTSTILTTDGRVRGGGQSRTTLEQGHNLRAEKLYASGGELVVGLANSLVWQFSGTDTYNANTLLNFSLVQPLLRGGPGGGAGASDRRRARMLANIRQMEQFRRGFYAQVVSGRNAGTGPSPSGPGIPSVSFASGAAGGILGLMGQQVRIRNQRINVVGLRDIVEQFLALLEAGRISPLQVEQVRQSLYDAESRLLAAETTDYEDLLDTYKMTLGLPPQTPVRIADPLLARFDLITPEMMDAQEAAKDLWLVYHDVKQPLPPDHHTRLKTFLNQVVSLLRTVQNDFRTLEESLPRRHESLATLARRPEVAQGIVEPALFDVKELDRRLLEVRDDFTALSEKGSFDQAGKLLRARWPRPFARWTSCRRRLPTPTRRLPSSGSAWPTRWTSSGASWPTWD